MSRHDPYRSHPGMDVLLRQARELDKTEAENARLADSLKQTAAERATYCALLASQDAQNFQITSEKEWTIVELLKLQAQNNKVIAFRAKQASDLLAENVALQHQLSQTQTQLAAKTLEQKMTLKNATALHYLQGAESVFRQNEEVAEQVALGKITREFGLEKALLSEVEIIKNAELESRLSMVSLFLINLFKHQQAKKLNEKECLIFFEGERLSRCNIFNNYRIAFSVPLEKASRRIFINQESIERQSIKSLMDQQNVFLIEKKYRQLFLKIKGYYDQLFAINGENNFIFSKLKNKLDEVRKEQEAAGKHLNDNRYQQLVSLYETICNLLMILRFSSEIKKAHSTSNIIQIHACNMLILENVSKHNCTSDFYKPYAELKERVKNDRKLKDALERIYVVLDNLNNRVDNFVALTFSDELKKILSICTELYLCLSFDSESISASEGKETYFIEMKTKLKTAMDPVFESALKGCAADKLQVEMLSGIAQINFAYNVFRQSLTEEQRTLVCAGRCDNFLKALEDYTVEKATVAFRPT